MSKHGVVRSPFVRVALAVLMATAAAPALAQHRGPAGHHAHGPDHGPGPDGPPELFARLDLSEDQQEQMRAIHEAQREGMAKALDQLREARDELFGRIHAAQIDEAEIRDAAGAVAAIEADLAVSRAQTFQQARAVLTPGQRARLDELLEQHGEMERPGPGGFGRRHGGGPGGRPSDF